MKTRVLTSIGIAIVGIPLLIFSEYIIFPIALSILAFIASHEMLRVVGVDKNYFVSVPAYLIALMLPVGSYLAGNERVVKYILVMALVYFAYLIYLFTVAVFMRGKLKFADISEIFATLFYVITSFTSLSILRSMESGIFLISLVFVGAWGCDVFAYLVGSFIGKNKLIPEISPKKTIEGSIGGIVFATLGFLLFGFIVSKTTDLTPNYITLLCAGFVASIVSQIGDLIASFIKREHGVKDYGRLLPGHGGIMDRFDSALAVSTVLMATSFLFPMFV